MNEDVFNASLRKFLKQVGVTSQREIEKAVRDALDSGKLKGHEKLPAKMARRRKRDWASGGRRLKLQAMAWRMVRSRSGASSGPSVKSGRA